MAAYHRRAGQGAAPPLEIALAQRFMGDKQQPVLPKWKSRAKASRVLTTTLSEAALPAVELLPPLPYAVVHALHAASLREEPLCADASIPTAR